MISLEATKLLVINGDSNESDMYLNDNGKSRIEKLSDKIIPLVGNDKAVILSSLASRVKESAKIIADRLEVNFEAYSDLWSDADHSTNFSRLTDLVKPFMNKSNVINVILVTHLEYVAFYPRYFSAILLEKELYSYPLDFGCMWVLDWLGKIATIKKVCP